MTMEGSSYTAKVLWQWREVAIGHKCYGNGNDRVRARLRFRVGVTVEVRVRSGFRFIVSFGCWGKIRVQVRAGVRDGKTRMLMSDFSINSGSVQVDGSCQKCDVFTLRV